MMELYHMNELMLHHSEPNGERHTGINEFGSLFFSIAQNPDSYLDAATRRTLLDTIYQPQIIDQFWTSRKAVESDGIKFDGKTLIKLTTDVYKRVYNRDTDEARLAQDAPSMASFLSFLGFGSIDPQGKFIADPKRLGGLMAMEQGKLLLDPDCASFFSAFPDVLAYFASQTLSPQPSAAITDMEVATAISLWDDKLALPENVRTRVVESLPQDQYFVAHDVLGGKTLEFLSHTGGMDTRTVYRYLGSIIQNYGTEKAVPFLIANSARNSIGNIFTDDDRIDAAAVKAKILTAYKDQIGKSFKVKGVKAEDITPSEDLITPAERDQYAKLKEAAQAALTREKEKRGKESTFAEDVEKLYTLEDLEVLFQRLFPNWDNEFRLVKDGKFTDQKETRRGLIEAWGRLTPDKRVTLIKLMNQDYLGYLVKTPVWADTVKDQKDPTDIYSSDTTYFDFLDAAKGESALMNYANDPAYVRKSADEFKTNSLSKLSLLKEIDSSFEQFATILRREMERGANQYVVGIRAKQAVGDKNWNQMKLIFRAISFVDHLENHYMVQAVNTVVDAQNPSPRTEAAGLTNAVLAARYSPNRSRYSEPKPYGTKKRPFSLAIDEEIINLFSGANAQGKSRLAQSLISVLIGFPVYVKDGYVHKINMPQDHKIQPLFAIVSRPGRSLFQGIALDTLETILNPNRSAYDEPGRGTSPTHQSAIAAGTIALDRPLAVVTHGAADIYKVLKLLDPDTAAHINPIFVEEYQAKEGLIATSSGGLKLLEVLGMPPEVLELLQQEATLENVEFQLMPESKAMADFVAALPMEKPAFISHADIVKLGFHAEENGIFRLMADLLKEKIAEPNSPQAALTMIAWPYVDGLAEKLPGMMERGIEDLPGLARRQALVEIFLKKGGLRALLANPYIRDAAQALPQNMQTAFSRFLERDYNTHLFYFSAIASLSQISLGQNSAALHLFQNLNRLKLDPQQFQEYIAPLVASASPIYSGTTKDYFKRSEEIYRQLNILHQRSLPTIMPEISAVLTEDARIKALAELQSLTGQILLTDEERRILSDYNSKVVEKDDLTQKQSAKAKEKLSLESQLTDGFLDWKEFDSGLMDTILERTEIAWHWYGDRVRFRNRIRQVLEDDTWNYQHAAPDILLMLRLFTEHANGGKSPIQSTNQTLSNTCGQDFTRLYQTLDHEFRKMLSDPLDEVIDARLADVRKIIKREFNQEQAAKVAGRLAILCNSKFKLPFPVERVTLSPDLISVNNNIASYRQAVTDLKDIKQKLSGVNSDVSGIERSHASLMKKNKVSQDIGNLVSDSPIALISEHFERLRLHLDQHENERHIAQMQNLIDFVSSSDKTSAIIRLFRNDLSSRTNESGRKMSENPTLAEVVNNYYYFHGEGIRFLAERLMAEAAKKITNNNFASFKKADYERIDGEVAETFALLAYANLLNKSKRSAKVSFGGDSIKFANAVNLEVLAQKSQAGIQTEGQPTLENRLNSAVSNFTPFDFDNTGVQIVSGSGLNGAGKSVFRSTVGQFGTLGRWGGFVPADACSISNYAGIFLNESEGTAVDASAYTESAVSVRDMSWAARALKGEKFLVLADEILAGTSEEEGRAAIKAVIEYIVSLGGDVIIISHDPKLTEGPTGLKNKGLSVGTWGFREGHRLEKTDHYLDPQSFKVMRDMGWPKEIVEYYEFIYKILERTKGNSHAIAGS